MEFLKSVLKWASIWTALVVGLMLVNDLSQGRPVSASSVVLVAVIGWIVMAGLVTFSKVMSAAERVGTNIGRGESHERRTCPGRKGKNASGRF